MRETHHPSYQTTPCTPRALPVRPAPLFARTADVLACAGWSFEVAVVQRAARPRDSFNSREAWVQVVGRGGCGHSHLCRGHRARLPLRFSILVLGPFAVGVGGGLRTLRGQYSGVCLSLRILFGVPRVVSGPIECI